MAQLPPVFNEREALAVRSWLTGAYTVHLNMQDYLWDGIKRDRLDERHQYPHPGLHSMSWE